MSHKKNNKVIKSDASTHISGNASLFSNMTCISSIPSIMLANGTKSLVEGIGNITTFVMHLKSILYVPNFPCNLLYVSNFVEGLNRLTSTPHGCTFQDPLHGTRICPGHKIPDMLHWLDLLKTSPTATTIYKLEI